jgi:hypothetical protein
MANRQLIHMLKPVGVEEDMEKLRPWLRNEESHRAVLSIVGFGGVGKTTIATALYRDFSNGFGCRASVTVSQNYDEDQVLRDILGQIKPRDRDEEQQDRNTAGRPAEKNLTAGTKAGLGSKVVMTALIGVANLLKKSHGTASRSNKTATQEHLQRRT